MDLCRRHPADEIDQLSIATIRTLTVDAVERAKSGHAGLPLGMAAAAYTLWSRFLTYDPAQPLWPGRDRFVLSAGHGSMLLYALLHLANVAEVDRTGEPTGSPAVSLDGIRAFRQLDSVCPGHPEYGMTTGVEATTGPLGQGVGDSVGMAIAAKWLGARYDRAGSALFGQRVYALCSDGDLMEGISGEAASLAGHLGLCNLCWIYDDNSVTIDGPTRLAFSEDVRRRFEGYGWATHRVEDANDCAAFAEAIERFLGTPDRPTLIAVRSTIGFGAPDLQGTSKAHSDPFGAEEVRRTKRAYGWPEDAQFRVPPAVPQRFAETVGRRGAEARMAWEERLGRLKLEAPDLAAELTRGLAGQSKPGWEDKIPAFEPDPSGMATREASGRVLNALAPHMPWLLGGSADLAGSNKTELKFDGAGDFEAGAFGGRNLHFGIREHTMGAIANGLALSGLRPFVGTFLVFSDYMRPPIRLAAMGGLPVVFVFSHDSIGLGQDGPTHQPVEQLAGLRAVPGLMVIRPCDANETAEAWRVILGQSERPACLVLSRQALPVLDRGKFAPASGLARGGYVLAGGEETPDVILIASGGEVAACLEARETLASEGLRCRVVSMPSFDLFEAQDEAYRRSVLPPAVKARLAVEAASPLGWDRYVGPEGAVIAMRRFGASAPYADLQSKFGFTAADVAEAARRLTCR
ncbi:transketolase [Phenylobacterium montanum]|uniref:Transketolase n=1 Tax=Phenylobacterium montanum TaxID=2823693 RepID=A0A975G0U8_9CAUL|nr:transketolase [Caulobacter sp. S6]QUD88701.1 transketolase [Caulobacter sp. S6]